MKATTRPMLAAVIAAAAMLPSSVAAAGSKPMSPEQSYALTCGHLGVPCNPPHKRRGHRARHAHAGRHSARRH